MSLSRNQIILASLLIILVIAGLVVGLILTRRSQTTRSEAAGTETPFATVPPFESGTAGGGLPKVPPAPLKGDCSGDGQVTQDDESCFMQHYLAKDSAADMDNSGQVNSLDLTIFRNLIAR